MVSPANANEARKTPNITIAICAILQPMNNAQRKTLRAIFEVPTRGDITFRDIENALQALGATIAERQGSRIRVALQGEVWRCHRPRPGKEAKKYQVEEVRELLERLRIAP